MVERIDGRQGCECGDRYDCGSCYVVDMVISESCVSGSGGGGCDYVGRDCGAFCRHDGVSSTFAGRLISETLIYGYVD